jgi:flagellar biosynthetic protein FliR
VEDLVSLIAVYALTTIRFVGLVFVAPALSAPSMPLPFRFWIAAILALIATPAGAALPVEALSHWMGLAAAAGRELLIGAAIGFFSALPLYALQMSGFLEGMQVGLSMATLFDPMSEAQVSLIGQFKYLVGVWFFYRWNGHLLLVQGLSESLRLIPLAGTGHLGTAPDLAGWIAEAFVLSMRLSLPILATLLLADVGLGFVARTVPQMNVFVLGLPLKFVLGFFLLIAVLPMAVDLLHAGIEPGLEAAMRIAAWWR